MLKLNHTKVTFVLPSDVGPVSVAGDWNDWDPLAHPMRRRSNGTRSVSVGLIPGPHTFRYLADGGRWLNEPDAPAEPDDYGSAHSVLVIA